MRSVGLGLAFAATVQFVLVSTPAFAQPPADTAAPATTPAPAAAPAAPTTDTPAAAPAAPAAAASGMVTVHVQSSKPVSLEHRAPGHQTWEFVCASPCDQSLSSSDEYHVVGAGLNPSKPFLLDTSSGDKVTLDVTPGQHNKYSAGTWVLVGGGVLFTGGVIALLAGSSSNAAPGNDGATTTTKNTNWIFVGTSLILGGVILGITGGSMMVDNAHTKVDGVIDAKSDSKKNTDPSISVKADITASRTPTWHDERGPALAPVTNIVPIINHAF